MPTTSRNLCLHYVSAKESARRLTLTRGELERLVRAEQDRGRRLASLDAHLSGEPLGDDRFTLGFDDAHASLVEHALPVLSAAGATATVFVPTGWVGTSPEILDWDGLARLRDAGWTIGSHAHTHARMAWRLYDEDDAAHEARLVEDLLRSRDAIERHLGVVPTLFAYPYGEAPEIARRAVRRAGFGAAFTVAGSLEWDGDALAVPRLDVHELALGPHIEAADQAPTAFSVVVPARDRVRILADVVTRLASQTYPKERYEVIVVDDGSREPLDPVVHDMPENVRLARHGAPGDPFRAGQARQHGADLARFDHLAFLDADVAVEPDFLWHLDWAHRRIPDAVLLGYLSGYNLHDLGFLHTPERTVGAELAGAPVIPDRSREPALRACLDNLDWIDEPWELTYTGNLSLPKALLARIGGFAHDFVGWGLEDLDLGIRLHRAGGRFAFSRFALGRHVVDPREGTGRNPFRARRPARVLFDEYLSNLERLAARHRGNPAVEAFAARSRADIDETCTPNGTVGIEMGGAARVRARHHARLHRVAPGGVPREELLDRVAYADKIGARSLYLLGGEPAEHPAFVEIVRAGKSAGAWVSMQTLVHAFGDGATPRDALDAPIDGAVALVHTFDRAVHETIHGRDTFATFLRGLDQLGARTKLAAHVVLTPDTAHTLDATLAELARRAISIEEVTVLDPSLAGLAREQTGVVPRIA